MRDLTIYRGKTPLSDIKVRVDEEDFDFINKYRWHILSQNGRTVFRTRLTFDRGTRVLYLHQLVLLLRQHGEERTRAILKSYIELKTFCSNLGKVYFVTPDRTNLTRSNLTLYNQDVTHLPEETEDFQTPEGSTSVDDILDLL